MKFQFRTAIPQNVERGSGCFVGIETLAKGLRALNGAEVDLTVPHLNFSPFTLERVLFNERLNPLQFDGDYVVGFDLDGYSVAGKLKPPYIAAIKGVLADAVPFESGVTRLSMAFQAKLEKRNAQRADRVITISNYCAQRITELYGVSNAIVVPELIDLDAWKRLFNANPAARNKNRFTVLCVCRFYPRKRVDVLLKAAALATASIPELEVRIVGNGPHAARLWRLSGELGLESCVTWVGDATQAELASEYNRADVFCLPSVQEGFGIVFLEAMAAGKPIIAARAAATPEVVTDGVLVNPDDPQQLSEALVMLYRDSSLRDRMRVHGESEVRKYDVKKVTAQFLKAVTT